MITVMGEALIDLVVGLDGSVEVAPGGAPFNTAIAAARLGADVEFAGRLSSDRFGELLAERLVADGVGLVSARSELPTTLAAAEIDASGAADYRFYIEGTSAPTLTLESIGLGDTDVLFTGGLGLVVQPMADTILSVVEDCAATTMVVFDVNCRPKVIDDRDRYVERVDAMTMTSDIVKVSDDDLSYLFPGLATLAAARQMVRKGATAVLVTAGSSGTSIVMDADVAEVPVPTLDTPVVDSIGAGDTFGGGLLAWWSLAGLGRADIDLPNLIGGVRAAHAAAGLVVTRRGADPPSRDDLPADWP